MAVLFINIGTKYFEAKPKTIISYAVTYKLASILCFQIKAEL